MRKRPKESKEDEKIEEKESVKVIGMEGLVLKVKKI